MYKNKLKWIKDLNIRPDTIKLIEENIGSMIFDLAFRIIFIDRSPQARETKPKINTNVNYIKLKSFCTGKKTSNKMKRQLTK